jgi:hypothetical protein
MTQRSNPYDDLPDRAFWSCAVSEGFSPAALVGDAELLGVDDRVMSIGSCFAANVPPYLDRAGIAYVRTESVKPQLEHLPEHLAYQSFSAAYGNVYTARQMLQLLQRAVGEFVPSEDRWHDEDRVIDPFRPGLAYPALSDVEFNTATMLHLAAVRRAVEQATVMIVTLGLTEAWVDHADGAVYPTCPGSVGGTFNPARHAFVNFRYPDIVGDLREFLRLARGLNPTLRFVLTVSPVSLVATATTQHVLAATIYSKSVLRAAAGDVSDEEDGVVYFPAYEIVTGPQAPATYFATNRRSVAPEGIDAVMSALLGLRGGGDAPLRPGQVSPPDEVFELSSLIAEAECDEEMLDRRRAGDSA